MILPLCSKCGKKAVIFIRYNGTHLCQTHFCEFFNRRVKKEIRKQGPVPPGIIAVALSGGKDSLVTVQVMHDLISSQGKRELHAITIDEGIAGYRPATLEIARRFCHSLHITHHVVSFQDIIGYNMDDIVSIGTLGACTYCGVFRRHCLNRAARDIGAQVLVMGHNLDDMSQSIMMNFVNNDLERMARIGPHKKIQTNLIPRCMPLRRIPEKETTLYALLNNITVYEHTCPYSFQATRGAYRDILQKLENDHPGTRHSILNSYLALEDFFSQRFPPADLNTCLQCGEPTSQSHCRTCQLIAELGTQS
jgi:uncharacterized protein (TIGR00269 family)